MKLVIKPSSILDPMFTEPPTRLTPKTRPATAGAEAPRTADGPVQPARKPKDAARTAAKDKPRR